MSVADTNKELIERFYTAFDARDGEAMAAAYGPGAHFRDPVFGELSGAQAAAMWRMFASRPGSDLRVELADHDAGDTSGTARWIARYTFGPAKRHVVNDIRATFRFADGRIVDHADRFGFWAWSRQALGPAGLLLGWTPILRNTVRRKAHADLAAFMAR